MHNEAMLQFSFNSKFLSSIYQNGLIDINIILKHYYSDQLIYNLVGKKLFVLRSFVLNSIIREFQQEFTTDLPKIYQPFTNDLPKIHQK